MKTTIHMEVPCQRCVAIQATCYKKTRGPGEMTTLDQLRKYVICDLTTNTHNPINTK